MTLSLADPAKPAHDGWVVTKLAIAVQLAEVAADHLDVVPSLRTRRVTRDPNRVPRREAAVNFPQHGVAPRLELGQLFTHAIGIGQGPKGSNLVRAVRRVRRRAGRIGIRRRWSRQKVPKRYSNPTEVISWNWPWLVWETWVAWCSLASWMPDWSLPPRLVYLGPERRAEFQTGMPSLRRLEIAGRCQDHGPGGQAVAGE